MGGGRLREVRVEDLKPETTEFLACEQAHVAGSFSLTHAPQTLSSSQATEMQVHRPDNFPTPRKH